jgi:valyl-tRNA synthetase
VLFHLIGNKSFIKHAGWNNALAPKMDASVYRGKAPQSVQEENMRKLTALLEQLEVISETEKKLDAN